MNQFPFNSEELKTSPKMAAIKVGFIKKKKHKPSSFGFYQLQMKATLFIVWSWGNKLL